MKRNPKLTWASGDKHVLHVFVADLSLDPLGKKAADLTGASAKWALARRGKSGYFKNAAVSLEGTVLNQTGPLKGYVDVDVTSPDTASLVGPFHWQLELTYGTGSTEVVAEGEIEFVVNIDEGA